MAKWTEADDAKLAKLYELDVSAEAAGVALNRSEGAVRSRASHLHLTSRRPAKKVTRTCTHCSKDFEAPASSTKKACNKSCAAKQRSMATRGRRGGRSNVGKRPDLDNQFFRSSWEANYARYLNHLIKQGTVTHWEFEPQPFFFPVKRGNKGYLPDFRVWFPDGHYEWHEVKGYMDDAARIKLKRFALHHPAESLVLKLIDRTAYGKIRDQFEDVLDGWE